MKVVTRGGTSPTIKMGPDAFGLGWSHDAPTYRSRWEPHAGPSTFTTFRIDGAPTVVAVDNLTAPRSFEFVGSSKSSPGEEVRLRHEPSTDYGPNGDEWGGLHVYLLYDGEPREKMRPVAVSGDLGKTPNVDRIRWAPDGTMRFTLPKSLAPGTGELFVNGTMHMRVRRCDAEGCSASVMVGSHIPVEVSSSP